MPVSKILFSMTKIRKLLSRLFPTRNTLPLSVWIPIGWQRIKQQRRRSKRCKTLGMYGLPSKKIGSVLLRKPEKSGTFIASVQEMRTTLASQIQELTCIIHSSGMKEVITSLGVKSESLHYCFIRGKPTASATKTI